MQEILRSIFRKDFKPFEQLYIKNSTKACEEVEELLHAMKNRIPTEYHALLDQYERAVMNLIDESCEGDFVVGYQLGVRMLLAAWPQGR